MESPAAERDCTLKHPMGVTWIRLRLSSREKRAVVVGVHVKEPAQKQMLTAMSHSLPKQ